MLLISFFPSMFDGSRNAQTGTAFNQLSDDREE